VRPRSMVQPRCLRQELAFPGDLWVTVPQEIEGLWQMRRGLKFCGALILNTFIAFIGTTVVDISIGETFHPQWSFRREVFLSLLGAAAIGFLMWRIWRTNAAKWAWVLPIPWIGVGVVHALFVRGTPSVFAGGNVWSQFSGTDCAVGVASGCRNFFAFTIPFIRGISYSVGAFFSSLLRTTAPPSAPADQ
jgi:hypothetical protein